MPQSLASVHIHLIFSTKHRQALINNDVRESLHRYMATGFQSCDCPAVLINSVEDHVHALFRLARTITIGEVVEQVKKSSSKWSKTQGPSFASFAWQAGYGAFGVSESNVAAVRRYIEDQPEHHQKQSFQDEFRAFLQKHRVAFDERYVWDREWVSVWSGFRDSLAHPFRAWWASRARSQGVALGWGCAAPSGLNVVGP